LIGANIFDEFVLIGAKIFDEQHIREIEVRYEIYGSYNIHHMIITFVNELINFIIFIDFHFLVEEVLVKKNLILRKYIKTI